MICSSILLVVAAIEMDARKVQVQKPIEWKAQSKKQRGAVGYLDFTERASFAISKTSELLRSAKHTLKGVADMGAAKYSVDNTTH